MGSKSSRLDDGKGDNCQACFHTGQRSDQSLVDRRRIAMMAASCCEWLWVCLSLSPLLLVFSAARDDNGMIFNPYVAYLII